MINSKKAAVAVVASFIYLLAAIISYFIFFLFAWLIVAAFDINVNVWLLALAFYLAYLIFKK